MTTSFIAMGIALLAVIGLVVSLGGLSLLIGAVEFLFGGPKVKFLRTEKGDNGFAFAFNWNSSKEPANIDYIQLKLLNAFGTTTQKTISAEFAGNKNKFAQDVDFGVGVKELYKAAEEARSLVEVEIGSRKDGVHFQFPLSGKKFLQKIYNTTDDVTSFNKRTNWNTDTTVKSPIVAPTVSFIADTVPGKGNQIVIPTNPAFVELFAGQGSGASSSSSSAPAENFTLAKVWIEPGCIVCNACEDIYPEVFEVLADTCVVRVGAPLDDGLRTMEAAEACPVEVIKYTKAS